MAHALRKCPEVMIYPPNHKMYEEYSARLMEFLSAYTPDIEQVSVDECYMDFTGIAHRFHSPVAAAFEIKEAVRKGKYSNNRMPAEIEKLLLECEIPEWYVESMKKILYLFPKTHLIVLLKRDICKFVKMNN